MKAPASAIKWVYDRLPKVEFLFRKLVALRDTEYGNAPVFQDVTVSGVLIPPSGEYQYGAGGTLVDYSFRIFVPATFPNTTLVPSLGDRVRIGEQEADIVRVVDYILPGVGLVLREILAR